MTWREDLRQVRLADGRVMVGASFRGVPFLVEQSERAGGRRTVTHEFPLRDEPFVEDLGRRARAFHVEAYIVGDDYVRQRDALLAALEDESGPGELVHPYHEVRRAICTACRVRETIAEGGIARLSLEFAETPVQPVATTEQADLPGQVAASADAAIAAAQEEFEATYDVTSLPAFALDSAAKVLSTIADGLGAALSPVVRVTQELAELDAQIHLLTEQAGAIVAFPASVLQSFLDTFTALEETLAEFPQAVLDACLAAYDSDIGPPAPETTATRQRERANQDALAAALRRLLLAKAAQLAPLVDFATHEDATAVRDAIASRLEEQAGLAGDAAYPALVQLRADLMVAVPPADLVTRLVTVSRPVAIPSLLLAYQLYGSVEQEADIVARNGIRHPGFVAGDLLVLSDG